MRTQIPGSQVRDATVDTDDLANLAVTDAKLSLTGVGAGSYTRVMVGTAGRVSAGDNPTSLAGAGLIVNLDDLVDVDVSSAAPNQVLKFDGSAWVNAPLADVDGTLRLYSENPQGQVDATASGFNSVALGSGATAGASSSFAFGDQSLSRIAGSIVHAHGRFSNQGDAQHGRYLLRTHTINALETELRVEGTGGSNHLTVPDDSTWVFEATIVGHQQDGNGHAGFRVKGVIYKVGAINTAILGAVTKEVLSAHSGWDVAVSADTTNGALKVTATGEAGKIIRWLAVIQTTEVTN